MKKRIFIIISLLFISLIYTNVNATTYARVINKEVNTYSGPGLNYKTGTILKYNDVVPLLNMTLLTSEKDCYEGFYKAEVNGETRYVCKNDVSTSHITIKTNTAGVNVRTGPGSGYDLYESVFKGKLFTLDSTTKYEGAGCGDGWYKIVYHDNSEKYICSTYVDEYTSYPHAIVTNTEGADIHKTAIGTSDKVDTIKYGQAVTLYEDEPYDGEGCEAGWYRIFYRGYTRYICGNNITKTNTVYRVNRINGLNVRESANYTSKLIKELSYMDHVVMTSTKKYEGNGCGQWYKIRVNDSDAYVCTKFVSPAKNTTITNATTNVRKTKSFNEKPITTLSKNTAVILENATRVNGTGCDKWYKVGIDGKIAYMCSKNTELGTKVLDITGKKVTSIKTSSGYYYTTNKWNYRLKESYGNVRTKATTSSDIQNVVYLGTEFEVLGSASSSSGCGSGWYKVKYYNGTVGYICKSLVEKYSDVTKSDSTYCKTLKDAGFPESYCPFLSYLHSKHPNWIFKAENTGVSFLNAINGESERNYTQINKSAYLQSYELSEAGGWRTASDGYVAYMLDPRNYLNEQNIFAFESLSYDSKYHTISAIRSIVKDTYLDTDTYAGYFLDAGKTYKVSPVHLASRVKQEGGTDSSYDSVSGKVTSTWNVAKSGYVCSSFGKKDGTNLKINSGSNPYIRSNASINSNVLKYSNGNKMTVNSNDSLTLLSTYKYNGLVAKDVNVRKSTNTSSTLLDKLSVNTPVSLVSKTTVKGKGCANWYKINYNDGIAYVCASYINPEAGCVSGSWYNVKVNKSLKGIYNYYNIGSYGSNPVLRGLVAAAGFVDNNDGTPWNTRAKAIKYGASFIANGYINQGQDTLYYQKFNTGPNATANRYTHQYMTNILAPASESLTTYESYSDLKILNKEYVFKIPVYNSMPTEFTTHPQVK